MLNEYIHSNQNSKEELSDIDKNNITQKSIESIEGINIEDELKARNTSSIQRDYYDH